jgi:hypothetical protein
LFEGYGAVAYRQRAHEAEEVRGEAKTVKAGTVKAGKKMSGMGHPVENDLALLAGGETGRARRFWLERHVRVCDQCQARVSEYAALRADIAAWDELPDVNWNFLAADMRANIRLGLEAGECVRTTHIFRRWHPRWTVAFASVLLLVCSGLVVRDVRPLLRARSAAAEVSTAPVLESNGSGVEFRTGGKSMTLLNHHGTEANQTASAQGDLGTRYIDSETSSVTINYVYLQ